MPNYHLEMRIFNRFRRRSTGEKSGRYLKYAIGEVILIVIGILIALQIDNLNADLKDRKREAFLKDQLQKEFEAELTELRNKIKLRNLMIVSAQELLHYIDDGNSDPAISRDSLTKLIQRTTFSPTFNSITIDFFQSHDISLIQNDSLRELLGRWPNLVAQTTEEELAFSEYNATQYFPFLIAHFQTRNMFDQIQQDQTMLQNIYLDSLSRSQMWIGPSKREEDLNALLENSDFEDHLAFVIFINNLANKQSQVLEKSIKQMLLLLKG